MDINYDVYMCRPDNRPLLTVEELDYFSSTHFGGWVQHVDVNTAIDRARALGYKIPLDIYSKYLENEQKKMQEKINRDMYVIRQKKKPSWIKGLINKFTSS